MRALTGRKATLGDEHPETHLSFWTIASFSYAQKRYEVVSEHPLKASEGLSMFLDPEQEESRRCRREYQEMVAEMEDP